MQSDGIMEAGQPQSQSSSSSYGDRAEIHELDSGRYIVLAAPVKNVVSFSGSFVCLPDFASGEDLLRSLTVAMLDKGTQSRSKIELATELESIGAEINFSTDGIRVRVSGRALAEDLPKVLSLLAEQLNEPSFAESELTLLKGRYEAALRRSLTETSTMASDTHSRRVFNPNHPFYAHEPLVEIERLSELSASDVDAFFRGHMLKRDWSLAVVGETDWIQIESVIATEFQSSHNHENSAPISEWSARQHKAGVDKIHIDDRENIDVIIGHAVQMTPVDDGYIPLYLGNYVLGGNFSARLMRIIRDEMGLTYGIRSSLSEMDRLHYGRWSISVTLSQDALEEGIDETMNQVRRFIQDGITEEETEEKKETIIGSFKVGLSSTRSLASSLLRNSEKGRDPSYLDEFPGLVAEVTASDINAQISTHFDPGRLHVAMAGTLELE